MPIISFQYNKLINFTFHNYLMLNWITDNGEIKQLMLGDIKECAMHEKIKDDVIEAWTE